MATALEVEMSDFFGHQYNEAWKLDGDEIAKLYCVPTVTVRGDGSIHCLQSHEELARFFQGVLDTYKRQGLASTTMHDLTVVPIGERSALASMTWKMLSPPTCIMKIVFVAHMSEVASVKSRLVVTLAESTPAPTFAAVFAPSAIVYSPARSAGMPARANRTTSRRTEIGACRSGPGPTPRSAASLARVLVRANRNTTAGTCLPG